MNGADEPGCTGEEPTLDGSGPPAFTDQERGANRPPAEVAPSAGFLPDTGAGAFGLVLLTGMILMLAGGTLIALKRPRAAR
jgi:LPXTG-motif cell wall-anchored protein